MKRKSRLIIISILAILFLLIAIKIFSVVRNEEKMFLLKNIRLYTDSAETYYSNCSQPDISSAMFHAGGAEGVDRVYMNTDEDTFVYKTDYSDWDVPNGVVVGTSSLGVDWVSVRDDCVTFCVDPDVNAEHYYVYSVDGSWPGGFPLGMLEFSRLTQHWFYRERGFDWDIPMDENQT